MFGYELLFRCYSFIFCVNFRLIQFLCVHFYQSRVLKIKIIELTKDLCTTSLILEISNGEFSHTLYFRNT